MCVCGFRDKRLDGLPCLTADPSQKTVLLLEADGGGGDVGLLFEMGLWVDRLHW